MAMLVQIRLICAVPLPRRARLALGSSTRGRGPSSLRQDTLSEAVGSMRRLTQALIGVVLASAAGCASTGAPASPGHGHLAACAADVLVLRPGAGVVPMTGEHAVLYALANRGPQTCTVRGYPQVTLYDADGRVLPFRYADGGGAYVTSGKPAAVVLAPGATAYVLVAKYRCDLGIVRNAATIGVTLPAGRGQVFAAREPVGVPGPPGLSYCRGGPHDPGQLVTVSPVEPTAQAASSLR